MNYGLVDATYDAISIPGDCVVRSIGYYKAYSNTEVRGYRSATKYSYWDQGVNFTLPFTTNQSVTLLNTLSGSAPLSTVEARSARPASKQFVARPMLK